MLYSRSHRLLSCPKSPSLVSGNRGKFDASNTWAKEIRLEFQSYKTHHLKSPRAKNLSILIELLKEQIEESDELSYNVVQEKYRRISDQKCKKLPNTSNCIRQLFLLRSNFPYKDFFEKNQSFQCKEFSKKSISPVHGQQGAQ